MIPMLMGVVGRAAAVVVSATTQSTRTGSRSSSGLCTSDTATVTASFPGAISFTYAWERVSGSIAINIVAPTSSGTAFNGNVGPGTPELTAVFRCLVTDNLGRTAYTNNCTVTLLFTP